MSTVYITNLNFIYNEKRIFQVFILLLTAAISFFIDKELLVASLNLSSNFWLIGICIICISLISAISTEYIFYSFVQIGLYLLLFLLISLVALIVSKYDFAIWLPFIGATSLVFFYCIKFFIGYILHLVGIYHFPLWPGNGMKYAITGFSNIRFFNQIQVFTLPLAIGTVINVCTNFKTKVLFSITLLPVVWWMLLIQSAGRGIMLSLLLAALCVLLFFKKLSHKWLWYFIATLAMGYLAKLLLFNVIAHPDQTLSMVRGGSRRLVMWPKVFLASLKRPFIGHGPMSFADTRFDFLPAHPHNSVLQILFEYGFPVTILVLISVYVNIRKWIVQTPKKIITNNSNLEKSLIFRISLTVAFFGALFYSLFSGLIVMPLSQLWFAIIIGSMMGIYYRDLNSSFDISINKLSIYGIKFCILASTILLIAILIKDVPTLKANEKKFSQKTSEYVLRPRFWQQGKIGLANYSNKHTSRN